MCVCVNDVRDRVEDQGGGPQIVGKIGRGRKNTNRMYDLKKKIDNFARTTAARESLNFSRILINNIN